MWLDHTQNILHHLGDLSLKTTAKPLNNDWKKLADSAQHGIILFSMGTVSNTTQMPEDMKQIFIDAFEHFPDYQFIWKVTKLEDVKLKPESKNIHLTTWVPQRSLLSKIIICFCSWIFEC